MTEPEWLACTNPDTMLTFLQGKVNERAATVRRSLRWRIWDLLRDERSRKAVEVAEFYADGLADAGKLRSAYNAAYAAYTDTDGQTIWEFVARIAAAVAAPDMRCDDASAPDAADAAAGVAVYGTEDSFEPPTAASEAAYPNLRDSHRAVLCYLCRCIAGNPFQPPPSIDPVWRTPTVVAIASNAYAENDFEGLPVLGDALEDAGCIDAALLGHLRGPGLHGRGCWCLDLILGKV